MAPIAAIITAIQVNIFRISAAMSESYSWLSSGVTRQGLQTGAYPAVWGTQNPSGIGTSRASDLSGRVDDVTFPQRISYITLGVRDMPTLRAFYAELGWQERPGSSDDFATYEAEGVLLALYPLGQLGQEAAP